MQRQFLRQRCAAPMELPHQKTIMPMLTMYRSYGALFPSYLILRHVTRRFRLFHHDFPIGRCPHRPKLIWVIQEYVR